MFTAAKVLAPSGSLRTAIPTISHANAPLYATPLSIRAPFETTHTNFGAKPTALLHVRGGRS